MNASPLSKGVHFESFDEVIKAAQDAAASGGFSVCTNMTVDQNLKAKAIQEMLKRTTGTTLSYSSAFKAKEVLLHETADVQRQQF